MMLAAAFVFTYYTIWAILLASNHTLRYNIFTQTISQPFLDPSSPIHGWFPSREWAVRLPAFTLVVGLSAIGLFVGSTIVKENRKKAQKARLRTA